MSAIEQATAVLDTVAPDAVAPEPFMSAPDAFGDASSKAPRTFALDIRNREYAKLKDDAGKYIRNTDGSYAIGKDRVSIRTTHGAMAAVLQRLPGAYVPFNGPVDYTCGARVTVTWKENGSEYTRTLRKVSTSPDVSGKNDLMGVVFAFKMADGSYTPWNVRVCNLIAISGAK